MQEDYFFNEGEQVGVAENTYWFSHLKKAFPAFRERNFRLYFFGQLISLCGTWLQMVALGWLVLQLTHSAFWVGTVSAIGVFPTLSLSLMGGVIVDKFDKKKVLYITQTCAMLCALALGTLTLLNVIQLWEICALAFALGVVNAVDLPALQAFVGDMVSKERLASAVALNSALQNAARAIGPALGGIIIALIGVGWTFIFNGLSFIAVLFAFVAMTINKNPSAKREDVHPFKMIQQGLVYTFSHKSISLFMITAGVAAAFGYSYTAILPFIAEHVFHQGATGLGYLLSVTGIGSLVAAIIMSIFSRQISAKVSVVGSNILLGIGLLGFSLATNFPMALVCVLCIGFAFTFEFSMINTLIQHTVDPQMRGRVMSILIMVFFGGSFLGNFAIGYFSNTFGSQPVIFFNAIIMLLMTIILFSQKERIVDLKNL